MEPRRYLRCLGQPALFTAAGEPIRFRTKKHLALLVYLAVETRGAHRRDRLAELLWPRASGAEARHSLATALSTLRPRLGREVLETTRDQVVLARGRVALDLERLAAGDVLGDETTGPLEVAAFLDGFDIADASEFMLWKDRQQARLLPAIKDALVILIDRCRRTGDSRQIEQLADRMLALDELSEEAIRAKMEARAFAGDRLTALKIFEEWKAKVAEELGAVPSDLVEGMAVRLRRRGWERTTLSDIPTVPTDQWRGRPFVGRSKEYRVLYEAWEGMRQGISAHAMVLGDSGIGKTTLVERLTTAAGLEGAAISRVQCYDLEREIPYATLGTLVHGLLDRPGVSATPPEALAEIGRTVPAVRRKFPTIPLAVESQGETARVRLTEAFQEMVRAIAEEHPVILVVDDLHLADDASLAVLHLMMRRSRGEPIMVMMIARPGELPRSPQAARLREAGPGLGVREVELAPLSEEESRDLLNSLVADQIPPSPSVRRTLLRAAGGFPMVLELLVQDWQTNGDQALALAVEAMTAELGTGGTPPSLYRQVLDRIVLTLEPSAHTVLNLAAILGHRLNDLDFYSLVDVGVGSALKSMTDLVSLHVLRDAGHGLEFINEFVRTSAYLGVPSPVRRILHGQIADGLISRDAAPAGTITGLEIAWHCTRAGRSEKAIPYLLRGAREAIRCGATHAAERALSTALPSLAGVDHSEATLLLAEVLQEQSRWEEALIALDHLGSSQLQEHHDRSFVLKLAAERRLGHIGPGRRANLPKELLDFIQTPGDVDSRARAAVEAASIINLMHSHSLAPELLDALSYLPQDDMQAREQIMLARAMLLYSIKDYPASLLAIREAIALLETNQAANSVLAMLHSGLGVILSLQGRYELSLAPLHRSYDMGVRLGNDRVYAQAAGNLALSYARLGEYRTALDWAAHASTPTEGRKEVAFDFPAAQSALLSYAMLGRTSKVDEVVQKERPRVMSIGSLGVTQAWELHSADAYFLVGSGSEAHLAGTRATSGENAILHDAFCVGPYARWVARLTWDAKEAQSGHNRVSALLERLQEYDALDQVEVLSAKNWLDHLRGCPHADSVNAMRERLNTLPPAVGQQLSRLGMIDFP